MGWWNSNKRGGISGSKQKAKVIPIWGDTPADIMDLAIDHIDDIFVAHTFRYPTKDEFRRGLEFSLGARGARRAKKDV